MSSYIEANTAAIIQALQTYLGFQTLKELQGKSAFAELFNWCGSVFANSDETSEYDLQTAVTCMARFDSAHRYGADFKKCRIEDYSIHWVGVHNRSGGNAIFIESMADFHQDIENNLGEYDAVASRPFHEDITTHIVPTFDPIGNERNLAAFHNVGITNPVSATAAEFDIASDGCSLTTSHTTGSSTATEEFDAINNYNLAAFYATAINDTKVVAAVQPVVADNTIAVAAAVKPCCNWFDEFTPARYLNTHVGVQASGTSELDADSDFDEMAREIDAFRINSNEHKYDDGPGAATEPSDIDSGYDSE